MMNVDRLKILARKSPTAVNLYLAGRVVKARVQGNGARPIGPVALERFGRVKLTAQDEPVYCLEIGRRERPKPGWLTCDLRPNRGVFGMDATQPFRLPDNSFHFIYSEHMIEHVPLVGGQKMLKECYRVLRPGGVIRIVTPSLHFLTSIIGSDQTELHKHISTGTVRRSSKTTTRSLLPYFSIFTCAPGAINLSTTSPQCEIL